MADAARILVALGRYIAFILQLLTSVIDLRFLEISLEGHKQIETMLHFFRIKSLTV
jgi:hypothetical protein